MMIEEEKQCIKRNAHCTKDRDSIAKIRLSSRSEPRRGDSLFASDGFRFFYRIGTTNLASEG